MPTDSLVIGVLTTLSGENALAGSQMLASVRSAFLEIGPISGHKVELIWEATDCTEASARLAVALLVQTPDLLAVIGPSCSADLTFSTQVFEDAGVAVILPTESGEAAFKKLIIAIEAIGVSRDDGILIIPRLALHEMLENQP